MSSTESNWAAAIVARLPKSEIIHNECGRFLAKTTFCDGLILWEGQMNSTYVCFATTNPEVRVEVEPVNASRHFGARLVDQAGREVAFRVIRI